MWIENIHICERLHSPLFPYHGLLLGPSLFSKEFRDDLAAAEHGEGVVAFFGKDGEGGLGRRWTNRSTRAAGMLLSRPPCQ